MKYGYRFPGSVATIQRTPTKRIIATIEDADGNLIEQADFTEPDELGIGGFVGARRWLKALGYAMRPKTNPKDGTTYVLDSELIEH